MNKFLVNLVLMFNDLMRREDGQDLVEYALEAAIIAFRAVTAMKGLSTEIEAAFNTISSDLGTSL